MRIEELAGRGTRAGAAVWLAATAGLIAWLIAYWFWQILVRPLPPPGVALESHPEALAQQVRSKHLFGLGDGSAVAAGPAAIGLTLVGIAATNGSGGVAVIVVDGKKTATARVGDEIAPGLVLSRVARDQVELKRNGQMIKLILSAKK